MRGTTALMADADEAWTQVVSALRSSLPGQSGQGSLVDDWMSIELTKTLSTPEAPDEAPSTSTEKALKLECNISINTNFLMSGIVDVSSCRDAELTDRASTSRSRRTAPHWRARSCTIRRRASRDSQATSPYTSSASIGVVTSSEPRRTGRS